MSEAAVLMTPEYPYSERSSARADELVAQLLAPPEFILGAEDAAEAQKFAHGLFNGHISDELGSASGRTLHELYQSSATEAESSFYLDYFDSQEGKEDLERLGLPEDAQTWLVADALYDVTYIRGRMDAKTRKEIAARSLDWQKDQLAAQLLKPATGDAIEMPQPLTCHYEPYKLLDKMDDLQAYRRFYRAVYGSIKGEPDGDLKQAKLALLGCHVGRVNNMMADLYPNAVNLAMQLDQSPITDESRSLGGRLAHAAPVVVSAYESEVDDRQAHLTEWSNDFSRRIDMVLNGTAVVDGAYTPISTQLTELGDSISSTQEVSSEPIFSSEIIALMDKTEWTATEMKELNEAVLLAGGRLSEHQSTWEEVDARDGYAPDGKWQVVVSPKKRSLSVSGNKHVMWVPKKFKRTLSQESPAGALPVSAHEQTHIDQTEYDEVLGQQIPLARIKGRRYVTVREMGGIYQEQAFQSMLGRTRGTNAHYLRALAVKEAGGSFMQSARAFYDSYRRGQALEGKADEEARFTAIDRTMRLYRNGGNNSQPLDYIEQELIMNALAPLTDQQRQAVVIAGGSFSLADSAALHRVGLLNLPAHTSANPTEAVMSIFTERYLPALQAAA